MYYIRCGDTCFCFFEKLIYANPFKKKKPIINAWWYVNRILQKFFIKKSQNLKTFFWKRSVSKMFKIVFLTFWGLTQCGNALLYLKRTSKFCSLICNAKLLPDEFSYYPLWTALPLLHYVVRGRDLVSL